MRRTKLERRRGWRGISAALIVAMAVPAGTVAGLLTAPAAGAVDGSDVIAVGAAPDAGSLADLGIHPNKAVLGISASASGNGYWMVAGDGGIFSFGDAPFYGSMGGRPLAQPMVGMAASRTGHGYWMFAGDGGIFAYGDAPFLGSVPGALAPGARLNAPILAMSPTPTGRGYWMVAADGGVFTFGDAPFLGSLGDHPPSAPITAMATLPTGDGYWVVTAAGVVYPFGAARSYGDLAAAHLSNPVVGIAVTATGAGYWLAQSDGQVWAFGDAAAGGLAGGARCLRQPVVGVAARPQGDGLWLATAPRPAPITFGLFPLTALDRENDDLVAELRYAQGCEASRAASSIAWVDPLPGAAVTSAYGWRIHPIYRVPQFHRGMDLAGSSTAIRAAAAGTVIEVSERVGYGITTVIDHGGKLATLYGHQARVLVRVGQSVAAGQTIGVVGSTGFATAPHLHVEIRVNGAVIDPTALLHH